MLKELIVLKEERIKKWRKSIANKKYRKTNVKCKLCYDTGKILSKHNSLVNCKCKKLKLKIISSKKYYYKNHEESKMQRRNAALERKWAL